MGIAIVRVDDRYLHVLIVYMRYRRDDQPVKFYGWLKYKLASWIWMLLMMYKQKGPILEDDLEYPWELHNLHNDSPLPPEQIKVEESILFDYYKNVQHLAGQVVHKLIPTLNDNEKYVLHYRNLQLCIDLRLIITIIIHWTDCLFSDWAFEISACDVITAENMSRTLNVTINHVIYAFFVDSFNV